MRIILSVFIILVVGGCGGSGSSNPVLIEPTLPEPTGFKPVSTELPVASPGDVNMDSQLLQAAFSFANSQSEIKSVLLLRNNKLVFESYFNGTQSNDLLHLRSVTKTITAAIVGIALEQGVINSLDQTVGEFLLEDYPWISEQISNISIRHLLTMSSGFDWDEGDGSLYVEWANSNDPVGFLFSRPLIHEPGTRFRYNSAAIHLLSVILDKATLGNLHAFVVEHFFAPMDITTIEWEQLNDGRFNGSSGLQLRALDLSKIATVFNNNGVYIRPNGESVRVVSDNWIIQMQTPSVAFDTKIGQFSITGYGFLWWLAGNSDSPLYLASGWAGQTVAIYPSKDLLVVVNTEYNVLAEQARRQELMVSELIEDLILPATL